MLRTPVLLLNQNYEPLTILKLKRAIVLLILGKVDLIENEDGKVIHAISIQYRCPSVIRLKYYVRIRRKEISLTKKNCVDTTPPFLLVANPLSTILRYRPAISQIRFVHFQPQYPFQENLQACLRCIPILLMTYLYTAGGTVFQGVECVGYSPVVKTSTTGVIYEIGWACHKQFRFSIRKMVAQLQP